MEQGSIPESIKLSICPGCGLAMPAESRVSYDGYYHASPECWSVYTEVLGAEFSNAVLFGQVHQLTVDTYAVQHAGGVHPDKSIAVHLAGLYLVLERGLAPPSVAPRLQQLAARVNAWPHFPAPKNRGGLTVFDVALAESMMDHVAQSRAWAQAVWEAWGAYHIDIARLLQEHIQLG